MEQLLGLKIAKSFNGYIDVLELNGSTQWTNVVHDLRNECKAIAGLENDRSSVIMYMADSGGEFYTISASIGGRNDIISAWIFRPWELEISGDELLNVIQNVRNEILATEINKEKLRSIFATKYVQTTAKKPHICTNGATFAVRYYNKKGVYYTIEELFSHGVAQKINQKYKAVFLVDGDYGLSANGCEDISNTPLDKYIILNPPSEKLIEKAHGFKLYLNNVLFNEPRAVIVGDTINVCWRKEGYADVNLITKVTNAGCEVKSPMPSEIRRIIKRSLFDIRDEADHVISNCKISIDNVAFINETTDICESNVKNAQIKISSEDYDTYTGDHDLTHQVKITLKRKIHTYTFITEDKDGQQIELTLNSNKTLIHTPLKGYHSTNGRPPFENGKNKIKYNPDGVLSIKWASTIIAVLLILGLIVGIFIGLAAAKNTNPKQSTEVPYNLDVQVLEEESDEKNKEANLEGDLTLLEDTDSLDLEHAIKYLDNNERWEQSEMEKYPDLRGLWNELNNYDLDSIICRDIKLKDSDRFKNLVSAINDYKNASNKGQLIPPRNEQDDFIITIEMYTNSIRNRITPNNSKKNKDKNASVEINFLKEGY